jgi:hypothetical protein
MLKWIFLGIGVVFAAASLWHLAAANAYERVRLPLKYGGPASSVRGGSSRRS